MPTPLVKVKEKAQITLPAEVRRVLGIEEGDYLEAKVEDKRVVLIPQAVVDKFPEVELSRRGEQMLQEAMEDIKGGKVKKHPSPQSLIEELHHEANPD